MISHPCPHACGVLLCHPLSTFAFPHQRKLEATVELLQQQKLEARSLKSQEEEKVAEWKARIFLTSSTLLCRAGCSRVLASASVSGACLGMGWQGWMLMCGSQLKDK